MGFLKDLTVSKISFVHKAANRRKFVLLKSDDSDNGEYKPMRKEVKDKLVEVFKSTEADKVLDLLKADTALAITESECAEIVDYVDVLKQFPPAAKDSKKEEEKEEKAEEEDKPVKKEDAMTKEENDALVARLQKAEEQLEKVTKENQRNGIVAWLQKECQFMTEDINKSADTIMELYAVNPAAAEKFKEVLQKSSHAVEGSKLFEERGRSSVEEIMKADEGFDLIKKVSGAIDTLKKSDTPLDAQHLVKVIKGFGNEYESYRRAHILRAKTQAV